MATARRRKSLALTEQLQQAPYRFEFFQAVRLLELAARSRAQGGEKFARVPVARGAPPNRESIRFQAQASLAFKGADLERVTVDETIEPDDSEAPQKQWQMLVNSFGLFGSNGVLPYHISELVIQRLRQKDRSLVNFLDVLNHRSTSLYYQAWHKYRLPLVYERAHREGQNRNDLFSHLLAAFVGLGSERLRNRLPLPDDALLGLAGLLGRGTPSAPTLARVLKHYFELPITVQQFVGKWQPLPWDMQSRLPGSAVPLGQNNRLGENVILGRQCWDIQSKFRIQIAELNYQQFISIAPGSAKMQALKSLVRFMAGTEFDFDIEISIQQGELPKLGLGQVARIDDEPIPGGELMLGWNSSLQAAAATTGKDSGLIRIRVSE
ncbi:MAG: type VI secretion system baseplate subunit TssG [Pseudomonadales bacterium]|nr:type VI secretion system baseplate subunit TssG [Pseudomonadales bacterium]